MVGAGVSFHSGSSDNKKYTIRNTPMKEKGLSVAAEEKLASNFQTSFAVLCSSRLHTPFKATRLLATFNANVRTNFKSLFHDYSSFLVEFQRIYKEYPVAYFYKKKTPRNSIRSIFSDTNPN